mgnify:CR=1 FL=1
MLIGVVILGLGLVIGIVSSSNSYFRQAPIKGFIINIGTPLSGATLAFPGASIGDRYTVFSTPGTSQVQFPNYPYDISLFRSSSGSSVFIGGYFVASGSINFTITSLLPGSPVIFSAQNVQAMGFLTPNAYFPFPFMIEWENANNAPLIVVGENQAIDPITPMFKPLNPSFMFALGLIAIGLLILGIGIFVSKMENEKFKFPEIHGSTPEILGTSLATWKSVFSRVTLPFAVLTTLQVIIISIARNINQLVIFELNSIINPIYSSLHRNYLLLEVTAFSTPIIYYLVVLFSFLLPLIAEGFVVKYAYDYITESRASLEGSLKTAARYSGKLLGASIFLVMILIAGLVVFVFPGIYLAVILSLIMQVIIIERTNIVKAISRSIELTKGKRLDTLYLAVFGSEVMILTFLFVYILESTFAPTVPTIITSGDYFSTSSITSFVSFLPSIIGFALMVGVIIAATIPFINIMMTVWYIQLSKQKSQTTQTQKEDLRKPKRPIRQEQQKQEKPNQWKNPKNSKPT